MRYFRAVFICLCLFFTVVSTASAGFEIRDSPEIKAFALALEKHRLGQFAASAKAFRNLEQSLPPISDIAAQLEIEALAKGEFYDRAVQRIEQFYKNHGNSRLKGRVLEIQGDLEGSRSNWVSARERWELARGLRTNNREMRVALDLKIGNASEKLGYLKKARQMYLGLWTEYPTSSEAITAEIGLKRIAGSSLGSLPNGADWLRRGDSFYSRRRNSDALAAYDEAILNGLSKAEKNSANYKRGQTFFRLRRYSEASTAFKKLGSSEKARFWLARSLARSGKVKKSLLIFEELAQTGAKKLGDRSLYLAATLLEGEGQVSIAKKYLLKLIEANSAYAKAALWRVAWLSFNEKRYEDARTQFVKLAKSHEDPLDALAPRYWSSRMKILLGDLTGTTELEHLAKEYPLTYYGWRARQGSRRESFPELERTLTLSVQSNLNEMRINRARILTKIGLPNEASAEIAIEGGRARNIRDHIQVSTLFAEAGEFHHSYRIIVDAYAKELGRGVIPEIKNMWHLAWPRPYVLEKRVETRARVPGSLLFAVMREESGYRPSVISPVGARGLMQIMPNTGRQLARRSKRTGFQPEDLFKPSTNLELGQRYLSDLLKTFDGGHSAAIAAYNAGPEVVARWLRTRPKVSDDLWVERVPYGETRKYIKRVLRSNYVYGILYSDLSLSR